MNFKMFLFAVSFFIGFYVHCAEEEVPITNFSTENQKTYSTFLGGTLIYNDGSDEVRLPISSLPNPLEGTFNLSSCGNTSEYISIHTGYKKRMEASTAGNKEVYRQKLEVWFVPFFLIKNKSYEPIMKNWDKNKAPIGIFWTWSQNDLNCFEHLITRSPSEISAEDLNYNYTQSVPFNGNPHSCNIDYVSENSLDAYNSLLNFKIVFPA